MRIYGELEQFIHYSLQCISKGSERQEKIRGGGCGGIIVNIIFDLLHIYPFLLGDIQGADCNFYSFVFISFVLFLFVYSTWKNYANNASLTYTPMVAFGLLSVFSSSEVRSIEEILYLFTLMKMIFNYN